MQRAFVTGACGFVGGYLCEYLVGQGVEVLGGVLDAKNSPERPFPVETCDVADETQCLEIFENFSPDVIYHLAGISFVPLAASDFQNTLRINVGGVHSVCRAAAAMDRSVKVVLASSGEVYGKIAPEEIPITEDTPVRPANAYSLSKLMAEEVVEFYDRSGKIEGYIMRPFNHIGPGQNDSFVTASFASQLAQISVGKAEPVIRVGNLEAARDFMDVRDVVRAYHLVLDHPAGVYNLSSGTSVSIQAILDILLDISGLDVRIEQDPDRMRPSEVPEVRGCFDKALLTFGWKPDIDIETSLRDIYASWVQYHS